jgi:hypothetical protein
MKSLDRLMSLLVIVGLAACSGSPPVQAQSMMRCSPSELSVKLPEFRPAWRATQQAVWVFQDALAARRDYSVLQQLGLDVIASIQAMSSLKIEPLACTEVEAFLFRMGKAATALKLALDNSEIEQAKAIGAAIDRDFPFVPSDKSTGYLYSGYGFGSPYRRYSYGGYASYTLHSHHHHHH